MNKTRKDGEFYTKNGITYFQHDGRAIEIASSYPDIETALAALRKA